MSGWGLDVFTKPSYYWWIVPVITTHIGAVLGAWIYYLAIGTVQYSGGSMNYVSHPQLMEKKSPFSPRESTL